MSVRVIMIALAFVSAVSAGSHDEETEAVYQTIQSAVEKLGEADHKAALGLVEAFDRKWDPSFKFPSKAADDANFIRSLTAYVLYEGNFHSTPVFTQKNSRDYRQRFFASVVEPCEQIIEALKVPVSSAKDIQMTGAKGRVAQRWVKVEELCKKLVLKPEEWSDLSFEVADMNFRKFRKTIYFDPELKYY